MLPQLEEIYKKKSYPMQDEPEIKSHDDCQGDGSSDNRIPKE